MLRFHGYHALNDGKVLMWMLKSPACGQDLVLKWLHPEWAIVTRLVSQLLVEDVWCWITHVNAGTDGSKPVAWHKTLWKGKAVKLVHPPQIPSRMGPHQTLVKDNGQVVQHVVSIYIFSLLPFPLKLCVLCILIGVVTELQWPPC